MWKAVENHESCNNSPVFFQRINLSYCNMMSPMDKQISINSIQTRVQVSTSRKTFDPALQLTKPFTKIQIAP